MGWVLQEQIVDCSSMVNTFESEFTPNREAIQDLVGQLTVSHDWGQNITYSKTVVGVVTLQSCLRGNFSLLNAVISDSSTLQWWSINPGANPPFNGNPVDN